MTRSKRSNEELQKSSDHLHYELWMLQVLALGMESGILGEGPLNNAVLEAFVVHARNLIYFLFATKAKQDHVIAADFFENADLWTKNRPSKSAYLKKAEIRANKEIAHLSYERIKVTPETKPWEFNKLSNAINEVFGIFFEKVPKHLLGNRWGNTIKEA